MIWKCMNLLANQMKLSFNKIPAIFNILSPNIFVEKKNKSLKVEMVVNSVVVDRKKNLNNEN